MRTSFQVLFLVMMTAWSSTAWATCEAQPKNKQVSCVMAAVGVLETSLATAQSDLATAQKDLLTIQADLAVAQVDLATALAGLSIVQASQKVTAEALAFTQAELLGTQAEVDIVFDITSLLEFDVDTMMAEFASTSASLDASVTALGNTVVDLTTRVTPLLGLEGLETLFDYLSIDPITHSIYFTGANVYVRSGSGTTDGALNGLGNLIVGYGEDATYFGGIETSDRSGSHNLVVGGGSSWSSYGGLLGGLLNATSGIFSSASGGDSNVASGFASAVSGGIGNVAGAETSSVSGGYDNGALGLNSSVSGGFHNQAIGYGSAVSGGESNATNGLASSIVGGSLNVVDSEHSSILGGKENRVMPYDDPEPIPADRAEHSTIVGGALNVLGGGNFSVVLGGEGNGGDDVFSTLYLGNYTTWLGNWPDTEPDDFAEDHRIMPTVDSIDGDLYDLWFGLNCTGGAPVKYEDCTP